MFLHLNKVLNNIIRVRQFQSVFLQFFDWVMNLNSPYYFDLLQDFIIEIDILDLNLRKM